MSRIRSVYVHYPFCKHLCHYCDFYKKPYEQKQSNRQFMQYLYDSLPIQAAYLEQKGFQLTNPETIYIGGGTPSLWGADLIEFFEQLKAQFQINFNDLKEFTIEVDPGAYDPTSVEKLIKYGVNRVSIGVQSFDPLVQPFLDRSHTVAETKELLEFISKNKMNFSVDFMLGLAHPSYLNRDIEKELTEILQYNPNHISLYILSVNEGYPLKHLLPDDEKIAGEYLLVNDFLTRAGFNHYEVSNYAKPGFESTHNWKYWQQESYVAFGPSATGLLVKENAGTRYRWKSALEVEVVEEDLDKEQLDLERLYTLARTSKGLPLALVSQKEKFIKQMTDENYAEIKEDHLIFLPKGKVILDTLIDRLL